MRVLAEKKGLTLDISIDPGVPDRLMIDGPHLNQILINLLGNAVKFTHKGGVRLMIARLREVNDTVMLRMTVADSGIGIPPGLRKTIFQPFERGRSEDRDRIAGTGLGLAITHRLIDMMGGTISLVDQNAPGTTFEITLPALRADEHQTMEPPVPIEPVSATAVRPLRILVAEDTPASQLVIRTMLEKRGHHVTLADDGQMAVDHAMCDDFDLVLLDIQMPHKDGYEAAAEIRRLPGQRGVVPVVALSAQAFVTDRQRAIEAGFDEHLAKPVRPAELGNLLVRVAEGAFARQPMVPALPETEPDMLAELREACGPDLFMSLLGVAVQSLGDDRAAMRGAYEASDFVAVRRFAHKLAGVLGQYGSLRAARTASAVETAEDAVLHQRLEALDAVVEEVLANLEKRQMLLAA